MEAKTMGSFIAALRRASGMTQKELAEKLNVSDKSVSRWERDDGAPDLSLIPVIAEIFGVTCDELLRGERKSEAERMEPKLPSPKGEKQRQRILAAGLSRFRGQSFIAMGIGIAGLIAAMICNLGFLRAIIGFFAETVFALVSVICQLAFLNSALLAVSEEDGSPEIGAYKRSAIRLTEVTLVLNACVLAFCLPLIVGMRETYAGIFFSEWVAEGLPYALAALVITLVVCGILTHILVKRGVLVPSGSRDPVLLRKYLILPLAVLIPVTAAAHFAVVLNQMPEAYTFQDFESFAEFMERDIPDPYTFYDDVEYYDAYGNIISEDEYNLVEFEDAAGNPVGTFHYRNQTVSYWEYGENTFPIKVYTRENLQAAEAAQGVTHIRFALIYAVEIIGVSLLYLRKRKNT